MAEDWAADVKKYASNADEKAIAGIVRYCGIALQKRDSSLVSFTDKEEVARVRDFMRTFQSAASRTEKRAKLKLVSEG